MCVLIYSDNLIQLADMVAGAIARSYREDDRKNARRWRAMLGSTVDDAREYLDLSQAFQ